MHEGKARFLLINPWIYDFAAYDFWSKPLGLLKLASLLIENNLDVDFIDCLDTSHIKNLPHDLKPQKRKDTGRGTFLKERIEKPPKLKDVPRFYSRYGLTPQMFRDKISNLSRPDAILITSFMTYWYPGIIDLIKIIREYFKEVPIILGGIYPTLCEDHSKSNMNVDHILAGPGERFILQYIEERFKIAMKDYDFTNPDSLTPPRIFPL